MVSGGLSAPFAYCTRPHPGLGERGLPQRGFGLGNCPQVRTGWNFFAIASLKADPGSSRKLGNREPSPNEADALAAEKLQMFHKDPFDRLLIAQALMGDLRSSRAIEPSSHIQCG